MVAPVGVAPVGVAPVGGLDCVTARPLGEGAEVAFSPIPGSVMVHARKLAASRIGAAGYESMRSLATKHGTHRKTRPGNKGVTNERDGHATLIETTLTASASYKQT